MCFIELDKKICDLTVQELKQIITDVVKEQIIILQTPSNTPIPPIYYQQDNTKWLHTVYCKDE